MDELSGTKIIKDLPTSLVDDVRIHLKAKIEKHLKPKWVYRGADVYEFGDTETGYVVLWADNEVQYFVRFKRIRHNGFRLGRQVLLWRNKDSLATAGFARKVFFDVLLPRYGALIADKEQTRNGAAFWANAIGNALDRKLYVYCLDRRSRQTKLTRLDKPHLVDDFAPILWGNDAQHLLTFAVISNKKLALTPKPKP